MLEGIPDEDVHQIVEGVGLELGKEWNWRKIGKSLFYRGTVKPRV